MKTLRVSMYIAVLALLIGGIFVGMRMGVLGHMYYHYSCERGYGRYPYGVSDGATTYYDASGKEVGECRSWVAGPTCEPAKVIVGKCVKAGVVRWSLF